MFSLRHHLRQFTPEAECHPDRSFSSPKGMRSGVEGPAVSCPVPQVCVRSSVLWTLTWGTRQCAYLVFLVGHCAGMVPAFGLPGSVQLSCSLVASVLLPDSLIHRSYGFHRAASLLFMSHFLGSVSLQTSN